MQTNEQNPRGTIKSMLDAANLVAKGSESLMAMIQYLNLRKEYNTKALDLYKSAQQNGSLGFLTVSGADAKGLTDAMRAHGINCMACKYGGEEEDRIAIIYGLEQAKEVSFVRDVYLAAQKKVVHVDKEVLSMFIKEPDVREKRGLSYAELNSIKDRAHLSKTMFATEHNKDGTYTIFYRGEDQKKFDMYFAGMQKEKEGSGKNVFKQEDYDREEREEAVNRVMGDPDKPHFYGSRNGYAAIYVTKEGYYFEKEGQKPAKEFVSRADPYFAEKLCKCFDQMYDIRGVHDQAEELGEAMKNEILHGKKDVCRVKDALGRFGYKNLKEVNEVDLDNKFKMHIKDNDIGPEITEAYYRLKRSVSLYNTVRDGYARPYVSQNEKQLYTAEHEVRMAFERCINTNSTVYRNEAEQYMSGDMGYDEVKEFVDQHKEEIDEILKGRKWSEPYDMPDMGQHAKEGPDDVSKDLGQELGKDPETKADIDIGLDGMDMPPRD